MHKMGCCLLLAVFANASCAIAKESSTSDVAHESLRIPAQAHVGAAALADAKFEFSCSTGKGGVLQLAVVLPTAESVAAFPFNDFEGPDGIGERKTLARWSVAGSKPAEFAGSISGWYGVDGDGFLFASSQETRKAANLARLLQRWLDAGDQPLTLTVNAPNSDAKLEAAAESGERLAVIRETLAPCLAAFRRR
jgi:hypothetical protein